MEYKLGKYPAIIRKDYEDCTWDYETNFCDKRDIFDSMFALKACVGNMIGIFTDNPRVLVKVSMICGKDAIMAELYGSEHTSD